MQPHYPHICRLDGQTTAVPGGLHPRYFDDNRLRDQKLQAMLANGYVELDRARNSYQCSVRFAWERASRFAAELSRDGYRVIISSDHGELFGEYGLVEHPMGVSVGGLVDVPWVKFEPVADLTSKKNVTDRLAALGYAEK